MLGRGPARRKSGAPEEYVMAGPFATDNPPCRGRSQPHNPPWKTPGTHDSQLEWRE